MDVGVGVGLLLHFFCSSTLMQRLNKSAVIMNADLFISQKPVSMKNLLLLLVLFCFMTPFAFAQTDEEVKEEVKKEMQQLNQELKTTFENLNIELKDLNIDLSGLDQLKDIEWDNQLNNDEGIAYLNSEEFQKNMQNMQENINKAMENVQIEMTALENIDWEAINQSIENAMKQVEKELSNKRKEE